MREHPIVEVLRGDDADIERAALLVAADAHPGLDVDGCLRSIDDMAAPLAARLQGEEDPETQAMLLSHHVYGDLGFHGNLDDYYDPRNSYLDSVLARRIGIPISLAVVLMAVGRRADVVVDGVGFPGHFLARVGGEEGVIVDPFDSGRVLDGEGVDAVARKYLGDPARLRPEHLRTVGPKAMIVRILMNLKHAHERRGDHAQALVVCDRIVDLTGRPEARRDRGLHALALGSARAATVDLEAYLEARPTARDVPKLRETLAQARKASTSVPLS